MSDYADANTAQVRNANLIKTFDNFSKGERITSAAIEHGRDENDNGKEEPLQVLGLRLYTNRGRSFVARALQSKSITLANGKPGVERDGYNYANVNTVYVEMPFNSGTLKGFFGRSDDDSGGIFRLGIIWCQLPELSAAEEETPFDVDADMELADDDDREELQEHQRKKIEDLEKKLKNAEEVSTARMFRIFIANLLLGF